MTAFVCPHCGGSIDSAALEEHEITERLRLRQGEIEKKAKDDADQRAAKYVKEQLEITKRQSDDMAAKQMIELNALRQRDEEARKKEMEFLKREQEMKDREARSEIEKQKSLMELEKRIKAEALLEAQRSQALSLERERFDHEKQLDSMKKQLEMTQKAMEDANRKANQGSMQIQGEIQEDALRTLLVQNFPIDIVSDVEKGIKGADIIQEVRSEFGQSAGIIAWESKNTKEWSDKWVDKLKEDRLRVGADISILVTAVLPKEVDKFGLYKGVWVVDWAYVLPIALMLRSQILSLSELRGSLVSKDEKIEVLYHYLTSPKFKDKVENIIDAFRQMKDQVDEERRAFEKRWKTRDMLLEQVIKNTSGLYGDLGGIVGTKLAKVDYLELGSGEI